MPNFMRPPLCRIGPAPAEPAGWDAPPGATRGLDPGASLAPGPERGQGRIRRAQGHGPAPDAFKIGSR